MLRYKLTDQNLQTYNGFQWEIGKKMTTSGEGELCGPGWLHCYSDPFLAVIFNPRHVNIKNPKIFEIECGGLHIDDLGRKEGFTEMTLLKEIDLPVLTLNQKIAFGIFCSLEVYSAKEYLTWANNWLSGVDRTKKSAYDAYDAANAAYAYAAYAYAYAYYADNAANAADAAAYAAAKRKGSTIDFISIIEKVKSLEGLL